LKIKLLCNIGKISATHKEQLLHGAVAAHGVCDATSAVGAQVVVALQKNCGSVEFGKKTQQK
jgi:hypothetical protein